MPNVNPFHGNDKPLPADNYILKGNNRNTRTRSEIYSKKESNILILCSSVITVNFEHVIAGWAGVPIDYWPEISHLLTTLGNDVYP